MFCIVKKWTKGVLISHPQIVGAEKLSVVRSIPDPHSSNSTVLETMSAQIIFLVQWQGEDRSAQDHFLSASHSVFILVSSFISRWKRKSSVKPSVIVLEPVLYV
jgi:hypothetical protein